MEFLKRYGERSICATNNAIMLPLLPKRLITRDKKKKSVENR